tara:strand:- start:12511 stop:14457 length:1947 start_codon:yes stop_codon:yes gene_type:complete
MSLSQHNSFTITCLVFLGLLLTAISCSTESTPVYTLSTSVEPAEAGTLTPTTAEAEEGNSLKLTATPNQHWKHVGWSGDLEGTTESTVFVYMDKDRNVTALFEKVDYPITINVEGEGDVSTEMISQKSVTEEYPHASVIRLTAEPATGWKFKEWGGRAQGTDSEVDIEIDGPVEVTATFERIDYKLTLNITGQGDVTQTILPAVTTETEYPFETMVQLNAVPADNWEFAEWSGDASGTNPEIIVDMQNEKEINALFVTVPTVETKSASNIGENTAVSGGTVVSSGGRTVTERGLCYSYTSGGEGLTCISTGSGIGDFNVALTELLPGTTYYIVAYAINSVGTSFGEQLSFETDITFRVPNVTTKNVTDISANTAVSGGEVLYNGGLPVTQKGVCVNSSPNVNLANKLGCTDDGTGNGAFFSSLSGMNPQTTYYVRAYATNQVGTGYGEELSFTTAQGSSSPSSPPPSGPSSPPPSSGGVQIALVFMDGVNIDVTLNGQLIPSTKGFDYTFGSAGVKVVSLSSRLTTMHLNPAQIKSSSLNNDGFGFFSYKAVNKNSDANLYAINNVNNGNAEFWGTPASTNALGLINNRSGDTVYGTKYPDPLFYLGWRFDPVNQPNNRNFEATWSNTGKMAITFLNIGQNHPNPAVP